MGIETMPTAVPQSSQEKPGQPMIAPEGKETLIKKWMSIDHIKDFFDRKSRRFFASAQSNDENLSERYSEFLKEKDRQSSPKSGDEFKQDLLNECKRYNEILNQMREGNFYEALKEIEEVSNRSIHWEEKGYAYYNSSAQQEELRAMAIALTDEMNKKRGEKEPNTTDEELNNYFLELSKDWESLSDKSAAAWLKEAIEMKDYKALADQVDSCIDTENFNMQKVQSGDMDTIRRIEKERAMLGERPVVYLHGQLKKLRRFRKYLFEKCREQ